MIKISTIKLFFFSMATMLLVCCPGMHAQSIFDIWDMDSIRDLSTMDVETLWCADTSVASPLEFDLVNLSIGEIRYNSYGGDSGTIRIQAFFAYPTSVPGAGHVGFVIGHGFGMEGDLSMAEGFAASLRSFILSPSAPGVGGSGGGGPDYLWNIVNAYPDPRKCWFYQFAYAVMRGLNYLEMCPQVDNSWLCVLGMSAGGVATSLADGVDDRIRFSVPVVSPADFLCSVRDSAWMMYYMEAAGIDTTDSEFVYLQRYLAPIRYASYFHGFVVLICGAQDEFAPLDCMACTYDATDHLSTRLEIIPNFDHVTYFASFSDHCGEYESFDNTVGAFTRIYGTTASVLAKLRDGSAVPAIPTASAEMISGGIKFSAEVPLYFWPTDNVTLWLSLDSAWTFNGYRMSVAGSFPHFYYRAIVSLDPSHNLNNIVYFVEVLGAPYLWFSSRPYIGDDVRIRVRPVPGEYLLTQTRTPMPNSCEMKCFPNPFNSSVRISIDAPVGAYCNTPLQIEIFDIAGKRVFTESVGATHASPANKTDKAGLVPTEFIWSPVPDLPSGTYLIKAKIGTQTFEKRVIYLK